MMEPGSKRPVTVLSGFPGAGMPTLIDGVRTDGSITTQTDADPAGVVTGTDRTVLQAVQTDRVGMAVWHRSMPETLQTWADRMAADGAIKVRLLIPVEGCEDRIETALHNARVPPCPAAERIGHDIADLIRMFAVIGGLQFVDMRLETVKGDACWKFHVDRVAFRLICTYSGPGTQYVPPDFGQQAIAQQRDYTGPLAMIGTDDVAIFKGAEASGHDGIVHRSPPILGSGQSRLMLCLSPPGPYSPDPEE
jgi:hypothetical protein